MKTLNDEGTGAPVPPAPNSRSRPLTKSELRKLDRQTLFDRIEKSATLAVMYPGVKTLAINLLYFDRGIVARGHGLRYRANLQTAKSMLHFNCTSLLCKDGGFDLSAHLSSAVAQSRKSIVGAMHCPGFRDQETGKPAACESILHFKITLAFKTKAITSRTRAVRKPSRMRNSRQS
jgi:hypothetical protein